MNDRNSPISEEELHAYVDGQLPADRREAVATWLAENPEQAALVAAWRAQAEGIRTRYGAVADEPVPERFDLDRLMRESAGAPANRRSWAAMAAAAAVAAFMLGGGVGWMARGASAAGPAAAVSGFNAFASEALEAHKLYVVEVRHPVEVPGEERAHMTAWLSKRLGYQQRIPDLQSIGLKLVGGRLLPSAAGAAAFYMYEGASGERFTIYCSKAEGPETALRFKSGDKVAAFYWADNKVAYAVSGPDNRERLEKVSKAIYDQIDPPGAKKL
jgi:anti-sigma factor RsiW